MVFTTLYVGYALSTIPTSYLPYITASPALTPEAVPLEIEKDNNTHTYVKNS